MKSKSLFGITFLLLFISCKKLVAATIPTENTASISALVSCCSPHSIIDDMLFVNTYGNTSNTSNARGNRFWVAATTINAVQEHRDFSVAFGFSAPPLGLNIYLTNWGVAEGIASTPLFGKRFIKDLPGSYINTFLVGLEARSIPLVGWYVSYFAVAARARMDMAIDYHIADMTRFTSDFIKETEYHELSHASHYTQVGTGWYTQFVNAELAEIAAHPRPTDALNPYGDGNNSNSPIIALGEAWGYHIGHFLADQQYGTLGSCQSEQKGGFSYCPGGGAHPHIDVLEAFNPNLNSDPFRWIPKGLMEDLIDNTPLETNINDQVSGFTIALMFNALQSDVLSLQQYRARFIQQNPNNQTTDITNLFAQYHY